MNPAIRNIYLNSADLRLCYERVYAYEPEGGVELQMLILMERYGVPELITQPPQTESTGRRDWIQQLGDWDGYERPGFTEAQKEELIQRALKGQPTIIDGRSVLIVDPLPQGELPHYDRDNQGWAVLADPPKREE